VLVEQVENVVDDRVLRLGEEVRLRKRGRRNVGTGIPAAKLDDDVVEVLLRAEVFSFERFHNDRDLPHVGDRGFLDRHAVACGRSVLIGLTASTPAPAAALERAGQVSFVWRAHHDARPLIYLRSLPPGCTTFGPGQHPAVRRSHAHT
jgi:hypothetical protein